MELCSAKGSSCLSLRIGAVGRVIGMAIGLLLVMEKLLLFTGWLLLVMECTGTSKLFLPAPVLALLVVSFCCRSLPFGNQGAFSCHQYSWGVRPLFSQYAFNASWKLKRDVTIAGLTTPSRMQLSICGNAMVAMVSLRKLPNSLKTCLWMAPKAVG